MCKAFWSDSKVPLNWNISLQLDASCRYLQSWHCVGVWISAYTKSNRMGNGTRHMLSKLLPLFSMNYTCWSFEVTWAVLIKTSRFWNMFPRRQVYTYQRFGGVFFFHLQVCQRIQYCLHHFFNWNIQSYWNSNMWVLILDNPKMRQVERQCY